MQGSIWNKWDLHIHCPTSAFNNQFEGKDEEEKWDKYLSDLEKHSDVIAIGVTDYFSIDGFKKMKGFKDEGRIPDIDLLIPNVELRIIPATGKKRKINLHILFNPLIADSLDEDFFAELRFQYKDGSYKLTERSLIELGRAYSENACLDEKTAKNTGLEQFCINVDNLKEVFSRHQYLRKEAIIGITNNSNDGASGLQHEDSLKALREDLYFFTELIFSSRQGDIDYFLGHGPDDKDTIIKKFGRLMPCVHGCDAHTNAKIFKPDGDRFTWIKAEPTFEGLRQILFEPKYRVQIRENAPTLPIHRISKINLKFPEEAKIGEDTFCLAGNRELKLSPNYTCIIGGRGVGKSMLLNLIHERLRPGENQEIKKVRQRPLQDENGQKLRIDDHVEIDGDADEKYIEFFSQNEIEEFALNYGKLTKAIYDRLIKRDKNGNLAICENELKSKMEAHQVYIDSLLQKSDLGKQLAELEREKETFKNILAIFSSEEYSQIDSEIKFSQEELEKLTQMESLYNSTREKLQEILDEYNEKSEDTPEADRLDIEVQYETSLEHIKEAINALNQVDMDVFEEEQNKLHLRNIGAKSQLRELLERQDLPEESVNEVTTANEKLISIQSKTNGISREIANLSEFIEQYNIKEFETAQKEYYGLLKSSLSETSDILKDLESEFVKPITLSLEFDYAGAQDAIFEQFKNVFKELIDNAELRGEHYLKETLFSWKIKAIWESQDKNKVLGGIKLNQTGSKAKPFLEELFDDKENLDLYFEIIRNACLDYVNFKQIVIKYDNKALEDSSFGQRCTAALVTLIVLGNTPIIIDEPEAHLDSLLISNFLVEVIKKQKQHRQIIFATHNANFVINADADLIHVLTIDENNITQIQSTTIENLDTRERLIALEGGQQAFKSRESRYALQ